MGGIITVIVLTILPFLYLFTQIQVVGNFTFAFGNIAGLIGATLLLWEFVLGIRDIAHRISPNPANLLKLHIFLGVWGMFFVLIHPILEMFSYAEKITFIFVPDITSTYATYITLGRIALILTLMVWLSSSFFRNKLDHSKWLLIHYLSYPLMFFVFIHALDIGSFLQTFPLIKTYWFFLMSIYIGIIIWRIAIIIRNRNKINYSPLKNEYK